MEAKYGLKITEKVGPELQFDLRATLRTPLFPQETEDLQREDPGPAQQMEDPDSSCPPLALQMTFLLCKLV